MTAPRGGWSEAVVGTDLKAWTSQPLRYALRKGESMTVRFTATDTTACDGSTVTWVQKADGIIIDPFIPQSPNPQVQMTPVADNFHVMSVTDGSNPPLDHKVVKNAPFTVTGVFRCGSTTAKAGSPGTVTLIKASGAGALGGTTTANVATTDTTATVSGATWDTVENGVGINVDWSASALSPDDSFTLDVLGDAATSSGAPAAPSVSTGATAILSNGANGPVTLVVENCDGDQIETAPCSNGTQIELSGNFKDNEGQPLYSNSDPAEIDWLCPASACPHGPNGTIEAGEPSSSYLYNYNCPGTQCVGEGTLFGEREVEEDFNWYPLYVAIVKNGQLQPFARAGRCVPLPTSGSDPNKNTLLTTTGQITDPLAVAAGFCVDVNAITRVGNAFGGNLSIPVLFVEDPKLRP